MLAPKVTFVTVLYSVFLFRHTQQSYQLKKVDIPTDTESIKIFTKEEIAKYDGSDTSRPLYMSVKGVVFDVSSGEQFYGAGQSYNILVGKDSSRAIAKTSLQPEDLTEDVSGLSEDNLKNLDQKLDFYSNFYGKGESYNVLIGKDASRAVAMMSLEPADLVHDLDGLSDSLLKALDDIYEQTYLAKYPVVGYMDYLITQQKHQKTDL